MDVYTAEELGGTTATGTEWRFLHFGPYSGALADCFNDVTPAGVDAFRSAYNAIFRLHAALSLFSRSVFERHLDLCPVRLDFTVFELHIQL